GPQGGDESKGSGRGSHHLTGGRHVRIRSANYRGDRGGRRRPQVTSPVEYVTRDGITRRTHLRDDEATLSQRLLDRGGSRVILREGDDIDALLSRGSFYTDTSDLRPAEPCHVYTGYALSED